MLKKIQKKDMVAYASDYVSFLLYNLDNEEVKRIGRIILFGSVARGEFSEESDVDLFIDSADKKIEKKVEKIQKLFYEGLKFKKYWSLLGIHNPFRCMVGKLEEWKDLRRSILSDGITLYGKYYEIPENKRLVTIFSWKGVEPESKRVLLDKRLSGYKHSGKRYPGLLEKFNGTKLKNSIIVPFENTKVFLELFRKMGVTVEIREMNEF